MKFNKKKHKKSKWMTYGILNSNNKKDRLYKLLLKTDVNSDKYAALKATFKLYKKLSDVALKKPKNYTITERFCCIKIMSEKHGLL